MKVISNSKVSFTSKGTDFVNSIDFVSKKKSPPIATPERVTQVYTNFLQGQGINPEFVTDVFTLRGQKNIQVKVIDRNTKKSLTLLDDNKNLHGVFEACDRTLDKVFRRLYNTSKGKSVGVGLNPTKITAKLPKKLV